MTTRGVLAGVTAVVAASALGIGAAAARPAPTPTSTAGNVKPTTTTTRSVASHSATATAKTAGTTFVVVVAGRGATANLRSGPGLTQRVIGRLRAGTVVHATGKTALVGGRSWRQIRTSTGTGWMSAVLLRPA
jgi:hypothetical protein